MLFQALAHQLKKVMTADSDAPLDQSPTPLSAPQAAPDYTPLLHLQQRRQHLEVSVEGQRQSYQSVILAVDSERGLLWIDELFPALPSLPAGIGLTLRHHRGGEVLTLQSPLVARGLDYGVNALALLLPDELLYLPRRQHPRFDLRSARLGVCIRPLGEAQRQGTLINLSLGGMRLALPGNQLHGLKRDTLLPYCEFTLPNQTRIRCQAVVKAARLERQPYRHTQVSLAFADMMSDRERLACYLQYLQQCPIRGAQAA